MQPALTAFALTILAPEAHTQNPVSGTATGKIFNPEGRLPLSRFEAPVANSVRLAMDATLQNWIQANQAQLAVAWLDAAGQVHMLTAPAPTPAGDYVIQQAAPGSYVLVADGLPSNSFPIVTHWRNPVTAADRGGWQLGATDGIGTLTLDSSEGTPVSNLNSQYLDTDPNSPFLYAVNDYALFDDGSGVPSVVNANSPAYERYIAENWALHAVEEDVAAWFSDRAVATGGLPVLHRNYPQALDTTAPATQQVLRDAPVFQCIHAYLVANPDDPTVPGSEQSLATIILPPDWNENNSYPVLFQGFYDIHQTTFGTAGAKMIETLAEWHAQDQRQAIGVLWNGGGAMACQTMQRSAFDNVGVLMQALTFLGADTQQVIMRGGSRGGTTALAMAANPFHGNYAVKFVEANNPMLYPGSAIDDYADNTYGLLQSATYAATGLKAAATTAASAKQAATAVYLGPAGGADYDQTLANGSTPMLQSLVSKSTTVVMRMSTHDHSHPFVHATDYWHAAHQAGLQIRLEIYYRAGHGIPANPGDSPSTTELLNRMVDPTRFSQPLGLGITRYVQGATGYEQAQVSQEPLVAELPAALGSNQQCSLNFVGSPGALVQLRITTATLYDFLPSSGYLDPIYVPTSFPVPLLTAPLSGGSNFGSLRWEFTLPQAAWNLASFVYSGTYLGGSQVESAYPTVNPSVTLFSDAVLPVQALPSGGKTGGFTIGI